MPLMEMVYVLNLKWGIIIYILWNIVINQN